MSNQSEETTQLKNAVNTMDGLSQEGFGKINGIAGLAIDALESSTRHKDTSDDVVNAFKAIAGISFDFMNCINCEAEDVGCHYRKEGKHG